MSLEKLYEIDRRALALGVSVTTIAREARVGSNTMARFRADPDRVNPRVVNKLLARLESREASDEKA